MKIEQNLNIDSSNGNEKKDKRKEEVAKFLENYFLRDQSDWEEVLLNQSNENLEEKRREDVESIKNYENGHLLKLKIFATFQKIITSLVINKKEKNGMYNAGWVSSADWKITDSTLFGELTETELSHLVNLRYDLIEEVLNTKIKPLLVGSSFKNSKNESVVINNIDFVSGNIEIEHNNTKALRNYYEVIGTSVPLKNHIKSIIKKLGVEK